MPDFGPGCPRSVWVFYWADRLVGWHSTWHCARVQVIGVVGACSETLKMGLDFDAEAHACGI